MPKVSSSIDQSPPGGELDLSAEALSALLLRMFEFSPVAMLISTTGPDTHRYVKANKAFLDLTGFSWDELAGPDRRSTRRRGSGACACFKSTAATGWRRSRSAMPAVR